LLFVLLGSVLGGLTLDGVWCLLVGFVQVFLGSWQGFKNSYFQPLALFLLFCTMIKETWHILLFTQLLGPLNKRRGSFPRDSATLRAVTLIVLSSPGTWLPGRASRRGNRSTFFHQQT
jgi:hypothetical protein